MTLLHIRIAIANAESISAALAVLSDFGAHNYTIHSRRNHLGQSWKTHVRHEKRAPGIACRDWYGTAIQQRNVDNEPHTVQHIEILEVIAPSLFFTTNLHELT